MRFVALTLILLLSGCLEAEIEDGRVFTVETLDRNEDAGPMYSMKENLSQGPVLNHYTPWPIVLPTEDDSIQRIEDQANLSQSIFEYFGLPGTPELFLIDQNGVIRWESTTYYPDENSIQEIENAYEQVI